MSLAYSHPIEVRPAEFLIQTRGSALVREEMRSRASFILFSKYFFVASQAGVVQILSPLLIMFS